MERIGPAADPSALQSLQGMAAPVKESQIEGLAAKLGQGNASRPIGDGRLDQRSPQDKPAPPPSQPVGRGSKSSLTEGILVGARASGMGGDPPPPAQSQYGGHGGGMQLDSSDEDAARNIAERMRSQSQSPQEAANKLSTYLQSRQLNEADRRRILRARELLTGNVQGHASSTPAPQRQHRPQRGRDSVGFARVRQLLEASEQAFQRGDRDTALQQAREARNGLNQVLGELM